MKKELSSMKEKEQTHYLGEMVMCTVNNMKCGLFNGLVGEIIDLSDDHIKIVDEGG